MFAFGNRERGFRLLSEFVSINSSFQCMQKVAQSFPSPFGVRIYKSNTEREVTKMKTSFRLLSEFVSIN